MSEPVTVVTWVVPALNFLYEHREDFPTTWDNFMSYLNGKKANLVITGAAGVGKTVLLDHLSGVAPKIGYTPPGRSDKTEKQNVASAGIRMGYRVVPGQASRPRLEALDRVFTNKEPVDGVIHVVANGHASVREAATLEVLSDPIGLDLNRWLEERRQSELQDLEETLRFIKQSHRKHGGQPKWLLVAVAKLDLFYDKHAEAQLYYHADSNSPFVQMLNKATNELGTQNFRWNALPVCSYLDRYTWSGGTVSPQLTEPERDFFLTQFGAEIMRLCQ